MTSATEATAAEQRQLLLLAIVTLVPFVLLAIWARFASPAPWEPGVLAALATRPGFLGDLSGALNAIGNLAPWAVVVGVAAVAVGVLRGITAAVLVALSFASDLAAFAVKIVVERARPDTAVVEQFFSADNFSFPSGHTVRAAAFAAVVIWLLAPKKWRLRLAVTGGILAGIVMGYARVSLGVHWPTDAIGATLLALVWFAVTTWIAIGLQQREERSRSKR